jgi:hypothetical protein
VRQFLHINRIFKSCLYDYSPIDSTPHQKTEERRERTSSAFAFLLPLTLPYIALAAPAPNEILLMYGLMAGFCCCCWAGGGAVLERELDIARFAVGVDMACGGDGIRYA